MIQGLKPNQLKDRITKERVMRTKRDDGKILYFSTRAEELAEEKQANETVKKASHIEENAADGNNRRGRGRLRRDRGRLGRS